MPGTDPGADCSAVVLYEVLPGPLRENTVNPLA